ncbi:MAG: hypothetical protein FD129_9 [bacterium]|nr:MAG: hypothetical protein FD129_9 [bacterium]
MAVKVEPASCSSGTPVFPVAAVESKVSPCRRKSRFLVGAATLAVTSTDWELWAPGVPTPVTLRTVSAVGPGTPQRAPFLERSRTGTDITPEDQEPGVMASPRGSSWLMLTPAGALEGTVLKYWSVTRKVAKKDCPAVLMATPPLRPLEVPGR